MATRFDINVFSKELMQDIEAKAIVWVNKALDYIKQSVDEKTPEDTKTLLKNNTILKAEKKGNSIYWEVFNNTEYAEIIEYWVRSKKYNYHKPKGTILYSGVWNRTFTRTADNESENIKNIIKKEIW